MKKIIALLLILSLVLAFATGCGAKKNEKLIVIGASATPHAEILEQIKPALAEQGYELEIRIFDDYVLPNTALNDGELDAFNFCMALFQSMIPSPGIRCRSSVLCSRPPGSSTPRLSFRWVMIKRSP